MPAPKKRGRKRKKSKKLSVKPGTPLFNFYEKLCYIQFDIRSRLDTKFQIFLIIAIPLLGFLASLLSKINPFPLASIPLFGVFCLFAIYAVIAAGYFFIISYWGHGYTFMAYAIGVEEYRKHPKITHQEFHQYLLEDLIEAASKNAKINDLRSSYIHFGNGFVIAAVILSLITLATYWLTGFDKNQESANMSITNPTNIESIQDMAQDKPPLQKPTQKPAQTQKPDRPQQRVIKEDKDKNK